MNAQQIRKVFIDYFTEKNHRHLPSSPLTPDGDDSLLFTNSGMVQFKDIFIGSSQPPVPRAVTVQRCLRAGGKHNDLEQVGHTARHHTYFEMLGNFSFGDYFKQEAIFFAWECLTQAFSIPESKLWVTVYAEDHESESIWLDQVKINPMRLIKIDSSDNFWQMGDTGPCGPCSEIFYDHGAAVPGGPPGSADAHLDRFTELWNVVFMEYFIDANKKRLPLPKPSIDTGMGLERLASVLQGVTSNYDTDEFITLQNKIKEYAQPGRQAQDAKQAQLALKVIADHLRAMVFLLYDGVAPSNEGRGYVLRRIIRRAARFAHSLGITDSFLSNFAGTVLSFSILPKSEQDKKLPNIVKTLKREEEQFNHTLTRGMALYEKMVSQLSQPVLPGDLAFTLYDTYGFPLDIIEDVSRERGISVDTKLFHLHMKAQKERGKKSTIKIPPLELLGNTPATNFVGYETAEVPDATLQAILVDGQQTTSITPNTEATVLLETTPFYAESGGQVGDTGSLYFDHGVFTVVDCVKAGASFLHHGTYYGTEPLAVGALCRASVDSIRRNNIAAHHSATHLLQYALRQVLGSEVVQKGSHVNEHHARFDFSHEGPVSASALLEVERLVNRQIMSNSKTTITHTDYNSAVASGALALAGERYVDTVRVLAIGDSVELCGGIHVGATQEIGSFSIVEETAVAMGVRRIIAIAAQPARERLNKLEATQRALAEKFNCGPDSLPAQVEKFLFKHEQLAKNLTALTRQGLSVYADQLSLRAQPIRGVHFIAALNDQHDPEALKSLTEMLLAKNSQLVLMLGYAPNLPESGQGVVVLATSKQLANNFSVKELAQEVQSLLQAKGGGRAEYAQLGSGAIGSFDQACAKAKEWIIKRAP